MKIIFETIQFIRAVLPKNQKIKAIGVSVLLFINSGFELIGLSAMLPVFAVLLEDDIIEKYNWASWIYMTFGLDDDKQLIILLTSLLFIVVLIKNLSGMYIIKLQSEFALGLYSKFAKKLHEFYYRKGFLFFKENNSNSLLINIQQATQFFANHQILGTLSLLNEFIVLLSIVVSIAIYDIKILILLSLIVVPSFMIMYSYVRNESLKIGEIRKEVGPRLNKNIFQSIFGYVDVIVSGSQKLFISRMSNDVNELVKTNIKANIFNLAPTRVIETSLMLAILVMNIYGVYYLNSKVELLQLLGIFAVAGFRVMPSINRVMTYLNALNQYKWTFEVLKPLQKVQNSEIVNNKELIFNNFLSLSDITYKYPGSNKNVIENFNLTITKGEVIGIIGESGSGKTTIMNMLLGFIKPTKGYYKIDDNIFTDEYKQSFYKKVGYVQQSVYIIDGTVAENVAFGLKNKEISYEKLKKSLIQASLWDIISELENGVETNIGENGTKLSGGQKQRIGIARALYFDSQILFFDEATSALDNDTENEISESIKKISNENSDLTIIIIAHRISTLDNCDRVIKL